MTAPNTTPQIPSRDDHGTTRCPVCRRVFTPIGRQAYCSTACRKTAFRRRHQQPGPAVTVGGHRPGRPAPPRIHRLRIAPAAVNDSWATNAAKPAAPSPAESASAVHAQIAMSLSP
jgi:hypothetical protein